MLRKWISVLLAGLLIVAAIVIVVLRPDKVGVVAAAFCLLAGILWLYDALRGPAAELVSATLAPPSGSIFFFDRGQPAPQQLPHRGSAAWHPSFILKIFYRSEFIREQHY